MIEVDEWVSVDDRLPPPDTKVLAFNGWRAVPGCTYDEVTGKWTTRNGLRFVDHVTHWQEVGGES